MEILFIYLTISIGYTLFTVFCFPKAVLHSNVLKKYSYKKQFVVNLFINSLFIIIFLTQKTNKMLLLTLFLQVIITVMHVLVIEALSLVRRKVCLDNKLSLIYSKLGKNTETNEIRRILVEEYNEVYFQKEIERAIDRLRR